MRAGGPGSASEFFAGAAARFDPARAAGLTASYRFDLEGAGSWHVAVADGRLTVSESGAAADCVLRMRESLFLELVRGQRNPAVAFMTGKIKVDGDLGLALRLQQVFF